MFKELNRAHGRIINTNHYTVNDLLTSNDYTIYDFMNMTEIFREIGCVKYAAFS